MGVKLEKKIQNLQKYKTAFWNSYSHSNIVLSSNKLFSYLLIIPNYYTLKSCKRLFN